MAKTPDSNRGLKIVVISMGMVLIGGTILLFILIFSKMSREKNEQEAYIPRSYRSCETAQIAMQKGETVREIDYDGMIARVSTDLPDGGMNLRLIHSCSGETLGQVTFQHTTP